MSDLANAILEAVGANDEAQAVSLWLDTGFPPLNQALSGKYFGGGLPCGRIIEIYGPSSCGKTAIITQAMIAAQRAGGIAMFNDHETSFDVGLAIAQGLVVDTGQWVYKQPTTFEESIDQTIKLARTIRGKQLIPNEAPIIVAYDSLASMVPQSKMFDSKGKERESEDYGMHDTTALARCTSAAFPALAQYANKLNLTLVFLNQIRTKPGVAYGDPTSTPGGHAPEFYSSVRISLKRELIKNATTKEITGQVVTATTKKNKTYRPFQEAKWRFMFREDGTGFFDVTTSTLEYLKEQKLIEVAGAYLVWDGKKYYLGDLAKKIDAEGLQQQLFDMLPK